MNEISQFDGSYSGSTIFNPLADRFGLSVDLVSDNLWAGDLTIVKCVYKCAIFKKKRKETNWKTNFFGKTPKS